MSDGYIGEIRIFAGTYAPDGWAFCNGQQISTTDNATLFALIGTTYGGDGQSLFSLPDLRGRVPVHQGQQGTQSYTPGQTGGLETVTLTVQQLPAHTHQALVNTVGGQPTGGSLGPIGGLDGALAYSTSPPNTSLHPASVTATGGGGAHANIQPSIGLNFIIATDGIWPA